MNYYYFDHKPDDLGCVPQVKSLENYNFNAPNSITNAHYNNMLDHLLVPSGFELFNRANFSDLICGGVSFPYLLISENLFKVIQLLNLPSYHIYPIVLSKRTRKEQYYIFIANQQFPEYLDFEKTKFYIYTFGAETKVPVEIQNVEDYRRVVEICYPPDFLRISSFGINHNLIKHDLFRISNILPDGPYYIVSEKFIQIIKEYGLTGISYRPMGNNKIKTY